MARDSILSPHTLLPWNGRRTTSPIISAMIQDIDKRIATSSSLSQYLAAISFNCSSLQKSHFRLSRLLHQLSRQLLRGFVWNVISIEYWCISRSYFLDEAIRWIFDISMLRCCIPGHASLLSHSVPVCSRCKYMIWWLIVIFYCIILEVI